MTVSLPRGRYISLTEYAHRIGVKYHTLRYRMINGTAGADYYRVGRAWLVRV